MNIISMKEYIEKKYKILLKEKLNTPDKKVCDILDGITDNISVKAALLSNYEEELLETKKTEVKNA